MHKDTRVHQITHFSNISKITKNNMLVGLLVILYLFQQLGLFRVKLMALKTIQIQTLSYNSILLHYTKLQEIIFHVLIISVAAQPMIYIFKFAAQAKYWWCNQNIVQRAKETSSKCKNQSYWFLDCHTITGIKLDYMPKWHL